jgi:hypothetical protein
MDRDELAAMLAGCSQQEKEQIRADIQHAVPHPLETAWEIDADTILSAIERSSDLTKRGVRGIIAEAVFEREVLPAVKASGWHPEVIEGDLAYDALLQSGEARARIQIKLQRLEKGNPKMFFERHYAEEFYVVEVQKTRSGEKLKEEEIPGTDEKMKTFKQVKIDTRPYRFNDFDILAVNMHPSCKDWKRFRYTLTRWLLPREKDATLISIMQPVAKNENAAWTDDLCECLSWLASTDSRSVLPELKHVKQSRVSRRKRTKTKRGPRKS